MEKNNEVKHLLAVIRDKLNKVNLEVNNCEYIEALNEVNLLNSYLKDLAKLINELNS